MASSSSLLSEEQFLCPICLDVFTRPVSTPCGHNFCMSCIASYWDDAPAYQCPVCKEDFPGRPDLKVNTFISEVASHFMSLQLTDAHVWRADRQPVSPGSTVLCDICTNAQKEAVKSCVECLTSYCGVHLEPHCRVAGLKRHTLVEPVANLEDRICKEHKRLLVLFCRDDLDLLCDVCAGSQHGDHDFVPLQQACSDMKDVLDHKEVKVHQMIQERRHKMRNVKDLVKQSKTESKTVIVNSVQDLMKLVSEIQRSQVEFIRVIEEKQKTAEEQADGFISGMEREIAELQRTTVKLRELKQTKDQLSFLRSFHSSSVLPHTMDLSTFSFSTHLEIQAIRTSVRDSVSQLRMLLQKINTEINKFSEGKDALNYAALRHMQLHEVNVVLDPDTAHILLHVSGDGKQVSYSTESELLRNRIGTPTMFTEHLAVLGRSGFSSGKFYFEVYVGQKTEWCLGVAAASIQREGSFFRSPHSGLWAIWFLEDKFESFDCPDVPVHIGKVVRVGVFVDYDGGQILFRDVETATLIHSLTECIFTEELYPYFNPCDNEYGSNLDPMIIVPVCHSV